MEPLGFSKSTVPFVLLPSACLTSTLEKWHTGEVILHGVSFLMPAITYKVLVFRELMSDLDVRGDDSLVSENTSTFLPRNPNTACTCRYKTYNHYIIVTWETHCMHRSQVNS